MPLSELPIVGYYDRQRFKQFNPSDTANWYLITSPQGKKKVAMYPTMGRRHLTVGGVNKLIFSSEPRGIFKSIKYTYIVDFNNIYRVDKNYNVVQISGDKVTTFTSDIFFDFLVTPDVTFAGFVDGQNLYIYREDTGSFDVVNPTVDPRCPPNPQYIATFGNRFVVNQGNSSQFNLTEINLNGTSYLPQDTFNVASASVFAQETGIIKQFGVLHNTLYIFTDYNTGIWSNIPSVLISAGGVTTTFPWKKNTTNSFDYGIVDPKTLSIAFDRMVWLANNSEGLIQVVVSSGQAPKPINTNAISVLFQRNVRQGIIGDFSPFLNGKADGFLYQYENTIFYRLSAGDFHNYGVLDIETSANSIEYNFDINEWHRVIEKNGERNRIQKHVFFNNLHFVTVRGDSTVYEMSGHFYNNEITNPAAIDNQAPDAYLQEPFRYERVTPIISEDDYGEFITDWVQIDFVWGENDSVFSTNPFLNAIFIIDEDAAPDNTPQYVIAENNGTDGQPVFMLSEEGNTPTTSDLTYNKLFKPHIELYFSDDGGISFLPADVREFSQLGQYTWRMRWYQLGPSRNRCYLLVCVSPSPIVVLGGVMMTRRVSDGAS